MFLHPTRRRLRITFGLCHYWKPEAYQRSFASRRIHQHRTFQEDTGGFRDLMINIKDQLLSSLPLMSPSQKQKNRPPDVQALSLQFYTTTDISTSGSFCTTVATPTGGQDQQTLQFYTTVITSTSDFYQWDLYTTTSVSISGRLLYQRFPSVLSSPIVDNIFTTNPYQ